MLNTFRKIISTIWITRRQKTYNGVIQAFMSMSTAMSIDCRLFLHISQYRKLAFLPRRIKFHTDFLVLFVELQTIYCCWQTGDISIRRYIQYIVQHTNVTQFFTPIWIWRNVLLLFLVAVKLTSHLKPAIYAYRSMEVYLTSHTSCKFNFINFIKPSVEYYFILSDNVDSAFIKIYLLLYKNYLTKCGLIKRAAAMFVILIWDNGIPTCNKK